MKKLELLSPGKNYESAAAAINHGADAVYIGAESFGARSAAKNRVDEIEKLVNYAHLYNSRVYVAFNTILFDNELQEAEKLIFRLWNAGVDALIIQDMGILEMDIPDIPLFASTQTDNRDIDHIRFLEEKGFKRIILARELSITEMDKISKNTNVDLEAFVHGALCVSYSGRCYLSAALGNRSANRGLCGQPCRLPWDLISDKRDKIIENSHLLSLKDMNRSNHLQALVNAGISSFKIEGRLKDISYVKNITAFYRKKLDRILQGNNELKKASSGKVFLSFNPDPSKTFNRGETDYFLFNEKDRVESIDSPKSKGEKIGIITLVEDKSFSIKTSKTINNGDGLCYFDENNKLQGLQVNRAENNKIFPNSKKILKKTPLFKGALIYRNHDHEFLKKLEGESSKRKIDIDISFLESDKGFIITACDEDGNIAKKDFQYEKVMAKNEEMALKTIKTQISKLGDSIFNAKNIEINSKPFFIKKGDLNSMRRDIILELMEKRKSSYNRLKFQKNNETPKYPVKNLDFSHNVSNRLSSVFYKKHGVENIETAFEIGKQKNKRLMNTKYCLRNALDSCLMEKNPRIPHGEKLFLEGKNSKLRLEFDCKNCSMDIFLDETKD